MDRAIGLQTPQSARRAVQDFSPRGGKRSAITLSRRPSQNCAGEVHHRVLERALRPGPPLPRSANAFNQGHDCRRGVACACAILVISLAIVGGHDGHRGDADECGTVAQGNVRLSRGDPRWRDLRRCDRGACSSFERNRAARGSRHGSGAAGLAWEWNPSFSVAPVTAVIVLLVPTITHVSPFASAVDRILEVSLGGVIGFAVSFFLFPSSAHPLVVEAAAQAHSMR